MGTNYYLYKKDSTKWILPKSNSVKDDLIRAMLVLYKAGDETATIPLKDVITEMPDLHIGKSSSGWHFSLCIYPSLKIYTLKDWIKLFNSEEYVIKDECDEEITSEEMIDIITNRKAIDFDSYKNQTAYEKARVLHHNEFERNWGENLNISHKPNLIKNYDEYLKLNHASRGLNGLLSHVSTLEDLSERDDAWKGFMPLIITYFPTNGTYDLTTDWDFS